MSNSLHYWNLGKIFMYKQLDSCALWLHHNIFIIVLLDNDRDWWRVWVQLDKVSGKERPDHQVSWKCTGRFWGTVGGGMRSSGGHRRENVFTWVNPQGYSKELIARKLENGCWIEPQSILVPNDLPKPRCAPFWVLVELKFETGL